MNQRRISFAILLLGAAMIALALMSSGGCAYNSAHPQRSGEWITTPIADDDYVDVYELRNERTKQIFIVNSRGGILEAASH